MTSHALPSTAVSVSACPALRLRRGYSRRPETRPIGYWLAIVSLIGTLGLSAQTPSPDLAPLQRKSQGLSATQASLPVDVLVKSPADTETDLQVICLFRLDPANSLRGSLLEIDQKLGGLLTLLRKDDLFAGSLGETLLIAPRSGAIPARRLLIVGLGDLDSFTPDRELLVGTIVFQESNRLGVAHPFFAPTVLDGGKTGIDTGDTAEQFMRGFLRAKAADDFLQSEGVSSGVVPVRLTFLAGAEHAQSTRSGVAKALANAASK
jgi:hypothetical protein